MKPLSTSEMKQVGAGAGQLVMPNRRVSIISRPTPTSPIFSPAVEENIRRLAVSGRLERLTRGF